MRLSPHFTLAEFHCHDGTPVPAVAIPALKRLCVEVLEPLRAKYGPCRVLSGYRHRAYNAKIGGARQSQHIYDDTPGSVAADVRFTRGTPRQWASAANAVMKRAWGRDRLRRRRMGGLGTYRRLGFLHVDSRPYRAEWHGAGD